MKKNAIIVATIMFLTGCAHRGGYGEYNERGSASSPGQTTPLDPTGASINRFDATRTQISPQANISSERAAGFTGQEGTPSANIAATSPAGQRASIDSEKSLLSGRDKDIPAGDNDLYFSRSGNRPIEEFEISPPMPDRSSRDLDEQSHFLNESADLHQREAVGAPAESETGRASSENKAARYDAGTGQIIPENTNDEALGDQVRSLLNAPAPGTLGTLSSDGTKNVRVSARNGTVTLKGSVNSDSDRASIESRVKAMPGVISVDNQLNVMNGEKGTQPYNKDFEEGYLDRPQN